MAVRPVIQIGHPSLKKPNKEITNVNLPKVKKLRKDLIDTMNKAGLIGIAAPQIAQNYMIFVTHPKKLLLESIIERTSETQNFKNKIL